MKYCLIADQPDLVGEWVFKRVGGVYAPNISQAIGQVNSQGELVAGIVYERFNGASITGHLAIDPNTYLTRQFLWAIADYPFRQQKAKVLVASVCSTNEKALALDYKLGFKKQATIEGGTVEGDLLILTLRPEDYRFRGITADDIVQRT